MTENEYTINAIPTNQIKQRQLIETDLETNLYKKNEEKIITGLLTVLIFLSITRLFFYGQFNEGGMVFLFGILVFVFLKNYPDFTSKNGMIITVALVTCIFIILGYNLIDNQDLFLVSMSIIIFLAILVLFQFIIFYSKNKRHRLIFLLVNVLISITAFVIDNNLLYSYLSFIGLIIILDFFGFVFFRSSRNIKISLSLILVFVFLLIGLPGEVLFNPEYLFSIFVNVVTLLQYQILVTGLITAAFVYKFRNDKLLGIGLAIMFMFIFMAIFAPVLAPRDFATPDKICVNSISKQNEACRLSPPNKNFIMGTTVFGLDVYSRIIWGAQIPLQMSFIAAMICFTIGVPMGLISGYYGGKTDSLMKTLSDIIISFPPLVLAILLSTFIKNIPFVDPESNLRIILVVSFSVGLIYIPTFYVIVRSIVLQLKESAFVEAARSLGASDFTIMFRYILPNVIAAPMAMIPFSMTDAILTGAALAFLGIGILPPTADWGYDMTKAIDKIEIAPWLISFPGIMLFLLAFSFSLIGDSLNEKYNPLLQKRES